MSSYPSLMDYFEKTELQRPLSAPPPEIPDEFEIRPLFGGARSEGGSACSSCTSPTWLDERRSADAGLDQQLAELTIANIDAHIANSLSEEYVGVKCEGNGLVDKMLSEIDAEIEAFSPKEVSPPDSSSSPQRAVTEATDRIQKFRTSHDYLAYLHDLNFQERYPQPLVRTEGRLAAFRNSTVYNQHQDDVSFILKHGNTDQVAAVCDFEVVEHSPRRERTRGPRIDTWRELGGKEGRN